jgi:D-arabinose 1-dehydrogenase-like Zn-dependent alcohol dehydrogenase
MGMGESINPVLRRVKFYIDALQVNGSCGECEQCLAGFIAMCERAPKQFGVTDVDQGSFSTGAVWDSRFVYRIPDSMASEDAAPLLCGGWTVWNALVGYNLKPTDHVGIVGIGGLGHLAIQFANKMGCEVTAFSGTESKREEAISLGAHHFVATKDAKELQVVRPINQLLITTNAHIDWSIFHPILAGRATVFPLQIPEDMTAPLSVPHMPFLMKSISVIYSTNGRHDEYDKLLAFAVLHKIRPISEKFVMSTEGIKESIERLESGKMRYRGVLVVEN